MNTEIKTVEPVDFATEMNKAVQERVNEKMQNDFLADTKKVIDEGEDVFIKLLALANVAKDYNYYTVSGIILDVIKARYSAEYQLYLTK